ncbi:MAG: TrmB family transcriptional regulator [Christensenellaceae bacterium]|nr:TrmB family transcriptional regulator [Christensenellaceae bacterium]
MDVAQLLTQFGLTRQEAAIYLALCQNGSLTGYEAAKLTGSSRSGTYTALADLVDKGAAYVSEDTATRYTAVPIEEFCANYLENLQRSAAILQENIPKQQESVAGYITISGRRHILDKMRNMLLATRQRLYLAAGQDTLEYVRPLLTQLIGEGKKIVLLAPAGFSLPGAICYTSAGHEGQIRLIVDSKDVLTGELGPQNGTCLYSQQPNLVSLIKEALGNELQLIDTEN